MPLTFKTANAYLPWVVGVGLLLGIANFSLGFWPTLGQSIFQQICISLIIGYGVLVVASNSDFLIAPDRSTTHRYIILTLAFIVIGLIGSEIESIIQRYVFNGESYIPFSKGGAYIFNAIMGIVIGWVSYQFVGDISNPAAESQNSKPIKPITPITSLPIKQGETISLHSLDEVTYFEAYDNYAFLYNLKGEKILSNNSLLQLEEKLGDNFIRVHRKYLINRRQILKIQPHLKGRYSITFKDLKASTITSSASYGDIIKSIIKI